MIILSNSVPKTGSTLLVNYQEDILSVSKVRSGQTKLRDYYNGLYIDGPSKSILLNLFKIDLLKGSLVVKCHWSYSRTLDLYCRFLNVRMTMAYRDPRDMILSLIDHGKRTRNGEDPSGAYADCYNIIDLIPRIVQLMERFLLLQSKDYVHCVKYEDMLSDPFNVLKDMVVFFCWDLKDDSLREIIEFREKIKKQSHNFNTGRTERWKTEMNQEEKDACIEAFKPYLIKLNYSLS